MGMFPEQWMNLVCDSNLNIIKVSLPNPDHLFGLEVELIVGENIVGLIKNLNNKNRQQAELLIQGMKQAQLEKRKVYVGYAYTPPERNTIRIVAHVYHLPDGSISVHSTIVDAADLQRARDNDASYIDQKTYDDLLKKYENLYNQNSTILESLPIGVELYGTDGNLLYLNKYDCQLFGVTKANAIKSGANVYQNPNLPTEVKNAVRQNLKVRSSFTYDFNRVVEEKFYESSNQSQIRHIECTGTPVVNAEGVQENYVFIVNDVTEAKIINEELRQSKQKTQLAMQASGIILWEFDNRTHLFKSENEPLNKYDPSKLLTAEDYLNAFHPEDIPLALIYIKVMLDGKNKSFKFDARIKEQEAAEWQYGTINGVPYETDPEGRVVKYVGFRKNNTELQKKRYLQEKILNNIPLPIHIKDPEDNYRYVFCNDESKRLFGASEQETAYDILDRNEALKLQRTDMDVFRSGMPYYGEEKFTLLDGRTYETIVRKSIINENGKKLLLNIRWDQSLQNELQRRAKILSISMNTLNAFTWFYDFEKGLLTFGDGFAKTGGDAAKMNSIENFAQRIHLDEREKFIGEMNDIITKDSGDFAVEYRIDLAGKGEYEWWECRGVIETIVQNDQPYRYMYGMDINIEHHKQTELMLLKNEAEMSNLIRQNELVLNNTNSGLAYISTDFVVQWENITACSKSLSYEAYRKGELCYKSAHNRSMPCEDCVLQRAVKSHQTEQINFTLNNNRTVEIFATPVFNNDGEPDGVVIRIDDITERQQMIADLKKAKLHAEQSDKLKSAFLANMSHEIRTPLNAIVGFSDLMMSTTDPDEKQEYMSIINTNNELLLKLISDILDLSKIESGAVELKCDKFDMADLFDDLTMAMERRITNPKVHLVANNPHKFCFIKQDKNRIAQILTNYVTNAIKYTPFGTIEMGYECLNGGLRLYVKDSGIGIAEEKKCKVFHRFEKLDEFAQGTGLGLSICKAIAEAMGGSVGFSSKAGRGSTFWADIPCQPEIPQTKTGKEIPESEEEQEIKIIKIIPKKVVPSNRLKTILVVEDNESNFLLVSTILKKHFSILHAVNGKEAVDMVREYKEIGLILMDMKMPIMNGLVATMEIRKFNASIPIIALTAHAFESDKIAAFEAGCNEYLVKPLNKTTLMAVMRKYCAIFATRE